MKEPVSGDVREVARVTSDAVVSLAKDTLSLERQMIVFVNTKRGAESQAEKIAAKTDEDLEELSEQILKVLSTPTKQCKRLAKCVRKGVAFHHSGLHSKQRGLIEDAFRDRVIKVICATPTLAAGINMPAFRVIIRDLKRYGGPWGMVSIPVLEYEQQAGRAGRPGNDPWGEAICVAKDSLHADEIVEKYIHGEPEEIYSKLAVEPVLRTYILSLVASDFVKTKEQLFSFFSKTFYAHQYGDMDRLRRIIEMLIEKLDEWEFLKVVGGSSGDFVSANELGGDVKLRATPLGKRVSDLYLDPYTAHHIIKGLKRSTSKTYTTFSLLHLLSSCLEMRPYLKVRQKELALVEEKLIVEETSFLHLPPVRYSDEFDIYLDTVKTAMLFEEWIEEKNEEELLELFNVRPGELHGKLEALDWLVYAGSEICRILSFHKERGELLKLRTRLKHGAKEELLPLLKLRNVGRIRGRRLFRNGVRSVSDLQRVDVTTLGELVGKKVAVKLKEQVGQKVTEPVKENKRKGQKSVKDWG